MVMNWEGYMNGRDMVAPALAGVGGFLLVFMILFYLIMMCLSIGVYVLESLGLYTIAKRRGIHNPWLAWIPVGFAWILGSISDQYQYVAKKTVRNRRKVLLGLNIAVMAAAFLTFILAFAAGLSLGLHREALTGAAFAGIVLIELAMMVVAIVQTVFMYIALYDLYASCDPGNATLYLVLSILFNITIALFVFICRKKDGGMPPRRQSVAEPAELSQPEVVEEAPAEETPVEETPVEQETETVEE